MKKINETEFQKICSKFTSNEVFYCVSNLVSHFAQNMEACDGSNYSWEEDILPLCQREDWEEAALEELDTMDLDDMRKAADYIDVDYPATANTATLRKALCNAIESDDDATRQFCDFQRVDPHTIEIYEHWIVSDYLAAKLEEKGEAVTRDFFGLTVWGRATTGQAISIDYVIRQIVSELHDVASNGKYK